jgi:hypothetical protein
MDYPGTELVPSLKRKVILEKKNSPAEKANSVTLYHYIAISGFSWIKAIGLR